MAGQVQHLICQDSLRKKKKKRQMRQFFLQSVYILWTHARSVLSPSPLKCIKEKKKKKKGRNGAVYFEMHLNLTEPLQRRQTLLQRRGDECVEECRLPTPQPKSAFHGSAARTRETVAHLLQQLMYRKLLGSSRAPLCAKVLGSNWKVHRMLPRSCLKKHNKKKPSEESCTNQPASQRCLRNKRINLRYWNWHEAAGWMPTHISNWDVISQKEKKKKKDDYEELAVYCRCEIRVRRDSGSLWI